MTQRVVKLKPEKPAPVPTIRLRRAKAKEGCTFPFVVGFVDEKGREDFLTLEEHLDYDQALIAAKRRAHQLRVEVDDATGVAAKIEKPAAKAVKPTQRQEAAPTKRPTKDFEPLSKQFRLPEISDERFAQLDGQDIIQRALALHTDNRDFTLAHHAETWGDSRDHACTYTQRTHDQVQGQILGLFTHCVTVQAILYAQLEAAFDKIDQLQRTCLTVDSFDAQVADDDRTIELAFGKGEQRQVASFKWPTVIYRGTYKAGQRYEAGDMVTAEGSGWIAQRATSARPGTPNSGFQLAVKRGKDAA